MKGLIKMLWKTARDNWFITLFLGIAFFTGVIASLKYFSPKNRTGHVHATVKLGQGFWWMQINKPSIWYAMALKKGEIDADIIGRPAAKILAVRYYPVVDRGQPLRDYDVYLTVDLSVEKVGNAFQFRREELAVGSPIELTFPTALVNGTIVELGDNLLDMSYIDKVITLRNMQALPWEFNAIRIGESYNDGEDVVFTVLGKNLGGSGVNDVVVTAKIKVIEKNGRLVFGNEQIVTVGLPLSISTNEFTFNNYYVVALR